MHSMLYMSQVTHTLCSYFKALECPTSAQEAKTIHLTRALANIRVSNFEAGLQ